jgi:hypothetical protein
MARQGDVSLYPIHPGESLSFSGKYRDAIFGDSLLEHPNHDRFAYLDNVQDYKLNSSGYRGPEFSVNTDLLFSGCSFTYGIGIPEDGIWGSVLGEKMGLSYNNLSLSGASISWMTRQIFAYFKKYGNPKVLVCLFPNPTKLFFASDPDILVSDEGYVETSTQDLEGKKSLYSTTLHEVRQPKDRPQNSKRPHKIEDVISLDSVIQTCMQNIRALEQYCRATGIKFLWGTWSKDFSYMIESQGLADLYDFEHYLPLNDGLWSRRDGPLSKDLLYSTHQVKSFCLDNHIGQECSCFQGCHMEHAERYGDSFYRGTDIFEEHPHFGVHRHIHIAEAIMDRIAKS